MSPLNDDDLSSKVLTQVKELKATSEPEVLTSKTNSGDKFNNFSRIILEMQFLDFVCKRSSCWLEVLLLGTSKLGDFVSVRCSSFTAVQ